MIYSRVLKGLFIYPVKQIVLAVKAYLTTEKHGQPKGLSRRLYCPVAAKLLLDSTLYFAFSIKLPSVVIGHKYGGKSKLCISFYDL